MACLLNREKDLIQVPLITGAGTAVTQLIRILLAKFATPFSDCFVRQSDAAFGHELFDIPIAETETEVELGRVVNERPDHISASQKHHIMIHCV